MCLTEKYTEPVPEYDSSDTESLEGHDYLSDSLESFASFLPTISNTHMAAKTMFLQFPTWYDARVGRPTFFKIILRCERANKSTPYIPVGPRGFVDWRKNRLTFKNFNHDSLVYIQLSRFQPEVSSRKTTLSMRYDIIVERTLFAHELAAQTRIDFSFGALCLHFVHSYLLE